MNIERRYKMQNEEEYQKENNISKQEKPLEEIEFDEKKINNYIKKEKRKKESKPTFGTLEVIFLLVITCLTSLFLGYCIKKGNIGNFTQIHDQNIATFLDTYQDILNHYYGEVTSDELLKKAIDGMLSSLDDPYSTYLEQEDSDTFNATLNGKYQGIGVTVATTTDGKILVISVFEDSPADKAGILVGDQIISINGEDLTQKNSKDFTNIVKESKDSTFEIGIQRQEEKMQFTITREIITIRSVTSKIFEQNNQKIGYLYVEIFANNTASQFKEELKKLEEQSMDSLIIDLRDNTGGHLLAVTEMLAQFLDTTHIIYQTETKEETKKYYSMGSETKKYPIVLLANNASASASEVMIAALKEEYGATLIGTTTFGKGTVQELKTLPNGDQYKVTTKKWLTPKGNWIHETGIKPDIEVELENKYYENPIEETDNQLQKAIEYISQIDQKKE